MTKQPLVMVEFTKDLDDMTDDELDELAGVIAEAMAGAGRLRFRAPIRGRSFPDRANR